MERIQDLIERDLSRQIEEIIKVYQDDEQTIYEEITEYVPTDNIKDHLADTLGAIAKSPQTHQKIEKMGLWISGFFGSGKSSFAKNLGLILSNPQICGSNASELFKKKFDDQRISSYIDNINARIPAKVIMFDIANTSYVRKGGKELISEVMYRSLLENLGYSKDFDIAELEIWLEKDDTDTNDAYSSLKSEEKAYILQVKALRDGYILSACIDWDSNYIYSWNVAIVGDTVYSINAATDVVNEGPSFYDDLPLHPLPLS